MAWNNKITSFNLKGLKVIRADNTLVCECIKVEDAKLIAAAPEMLNALQSILKFCGSPIIDKPNPDSLYYKIKSAIEKATK